jgi:hypothetical protein
MCMHIVQDGMLNCDDLCHHKMDRGDAQRGMGRVTREIIHVRTNAIQTIPRI